MQFHSFLFLYVVMVTSRPDSVNRTFSSSVVDQIIESLCPLFSNKKLCVSLIFTMLILMWHKK